MAKEWFLDVRDKPGVLWAFLNQFAGTGIVSLEGSLAELHLDDFPGASDVETPLLQRTTQSPLLDFVTLPITADVIAALKGRLARPGLFPDGGAIIHVQIQSGEKVVLGAYDNFHRDCVVARDPTPEQLLKGLQRDGVIRSYEIAA